MLFSSDWPIFVVLTILTFSSINCDPWSENGTVSSVFATKGLRSRMEDTFIRIEGDSGIGIFGVFDGHGGDFAAKFAAEYFPKQIQDEIAISVSDPEYCMYETGSELNFEPMLRNIIGRADTHLKAEYIKTNNDSGTTCLLAIVEKRKLTVANVGDSRGVMCNIHGTAIDLSNDHKPNSADEKKRIEEAGGSIYQMFGVWRVDTLALSRSLGDHRIKSFANNVIGDPSILTFDLNLYRPKFMILASDGLWDVMSSQEAVDFIKTRYSSGDDFGAEELAMHAMNDKRPISTDNITVVIVVFDKNGHYKVSSASA